MKPSSSSSAQRIDLVDDQGLCTECGACWGVCPKANISITENEHGNLRFRRHNFSRCGDCHLCEEICPGMRVDFNQLHRDVFREQNHFERADADIGRYRNLYLGHAADQDFRHGGASGGVTTALLAKALQDENLDGVFVARMQKSDAGSPLSAKIYLAKNRDELLEGQQSKYTSVPMGKCLRNIIYQGKGKRYAFVGLGCHMQALRKAEGILPQLKKRIAIRVGLVCGHCMDRRGTRHLLDLVKAKEQNVHKIEYRSDRWPGNFKVTLLNGKTERIGQIDWTSYVMTLYEKDRCHFCTDPMNQLSDITTGDPWLNELSHEPGMNLIISRTEEGDQFLKSAIHEGQVMVTPTTEEKMVRSQRRSLYRKRYAIRAYMQIVKKMGKSVPVYSGQFDSRRLTWHEYREVIMLMVFRFFATRPMSRKLIAPCGRLFMDYMRRRREITGRMVLK